MSILTFWKYRHPNNRAFYTLNFFSKLLENLRVLWRSLARRGGEFLLFLEILSTVVCHLFFVFFFLFFFKSTKSLKQIRYTLIKLIRMRPVTMKPVNRCPPNHDRSDNGTGILLKKKSTCLYCRLGRVYGVTVGFRTIEWPVVDYFL